MIANRAPDYAKFEVSVLTKISLWQPIRIIHVSGPVCSKHCHLNEIISQGLSTVKILKFGTPQTIAILVLKMEKFDVTLH